MAPIEPVGGSRGPTIVTEGIPDALAAACGGYRAVAVLGTGLPNDAVAQRLQRMPGPLVLMFDADCAGRSGSDRLCKLLGHAGRADVLKIEPPAQDLNTWLVTRGRAAFTQQMQMLIGLARPGSGRSRSIA